MEFTSAVPGDVLIRRWKWSMLTATPMRPSGVSNGINMLITWPRPLLVAYLPRHGNCARQATSVAWVAPPSVGAPAAG